MANRRYRPTTPARRGMSVSDFATITTDRPLKSKTSANPRKAGRNAQGRITTRRQGGGHKRRYREIDFRRNKDNVPATVAEIEYDPNRTAHTALVRYADGERRYILAPHGLAVGAKIVSGPEAPLETGNRTVLQRIPTGAFVHNIEFFPARGGASGAPKDYSRVSSCGARSSRRPTPPPVRLPAVELPAASRQAPSAP